MKSGTEVEVVRLPNCDICELAGEQVTAQYDARVITSGNRPNPWAHMCLDCFNQYGAGLGVGVGQKLILIGSDGR